MCANRYSKEVSFEDILEIHPYLIDESLVDGKLERQYPIELNDGRFNYIDLIYFKETEITVIELKRAEIKKVDVSQLSGYVNYIRNKFPGRIVKGIIVGQSIKKEILKDVEIRAFAYRELFRDIPVRIKICSNCRKAVDERKIKCYWCNSNVFL